MSQGITGNGKSHSGTKVPTVNVSVGCLLFATAAAWIGTGILLTGITAAFGRSEWWLALSGASAIGAVAGMLGLFPVLLAARTGLLQIIIFSFLAGGLLRIVGVFVGLLLLKQSFEQAAVPLVIMALVYYVSSLSAEVVVLKQALKRADGSTLKSQVKED